MYPPLDIMVQYFDSRQAFSPQCLLKTSCRCWYENTSLSTTLTLLLSATSHRLVFQQCCRGNGIILLTWPQKNLSAIFILSNLAPSTSRSLEFSLLWPRSQGTRSWPSRSNRVFEDSPHNCIVAVRAQKSVRKLQNCQHQCTNIQIRGLF